MHSYSINTKERKTVLFFIVIISILVNTFFIKTINYFQISLPWWFYGPSVFLFFGILFKIFDEYFWILFQKINIIKTPNFNGEWNGTVYTSFNNHLSGKKAKLSISQSWTRIKILLNTDESSSESKNASISINPPGEEYLCYQYINYPKTNAAKTMHTHIGTAFNIKLSKNKKELEGEYYSGRDRKNIGILKFTRI